MLVCTMPTFNVTEFPKRLCIFSNLQSIWKDETANRTPFYVLGIHALECMIHLSYLVILYILTPDSVVCQSLCVVCLCVCVCLCMSTLISIILMSSNTYFEN